MRGEALPARGHAGQVRGLVSLARQPLASALSEASAAYLEVPEPIEEAAQQILHLSRAFFSASAAVKERSALGRSSALCGYVAPGQELTSGQLDLKVSLEFAQSDPERGGRLDGEGPRLLAENLWPEEGDFPGFRVMFETYHRRLADLAQRLFVQLTDEGIISLPAKAAAEGEQPSEPSHWRSRVLRYAPRSALPGEPLVAAHTDIALFNLLYIERPGLEVKSAGGRWCPVEPREGHLVVLFGELSAHLSGGAIRPCSHRVLATQSATPRMSIPFFVYPPLSTRLDGVAPALDVRGGRVQDLLLERIRASWPHCFENPSTASPSPESTSLPPQLRKISHE